MKPTPCAVFLKVSQRPQDNLIYKAPAFVIMHTKTFIHSSSLGDEKGVSSSFPGLRLEQLVIAFCVCTTVMFSILYWGHFVGKYFCKAWQQQFLFTRLLLFGKFSTFWTRNVLFTWEVIFGAVVAASKTASRTTTLYSDTQSRSEFCKIWYSCKRGGFHFQLASILCALKLCWLPLQLNFPEPLKNSYERCKVMVEYTF